MVLNTKEVATLLNRSVRQVNYLVEKGELTPIKQYHKYNLFDEKQVLNFKAQRDGSSK